MNNKEQKVETSTESAIVGNTVLADVAKCQSCGKNNGTDELHSCPYNADINNDDSPCCNCCSDCCHECARDI